MRYKTGKNTIEGYSHKINALKFCDDFGRFFAFLTVVFKDFSYIASRLRRKKGPFLIVLFLATAMGFNPAGPYI